MPIMSRFLLAAAPLMIAAQSQTDHWAVLIAGSNTYGNYRYLPLPISPQHDATRGLSSDPPPDALTPGATAISFRFPITPRGDATRGRRLARPLL
jgi:hypothetical protein